VSRPDWDPEQYNRFADERSRPFFDLLAGVDLVTRSGGFPRTIADLGCGPGNLTASLLARWPDALVVGVDSSPAMLEQAAPQTVPGRLTFVLEDLARWEPGDPVDLIVSNAALQWVPGHRALLPRLAAMLAPAGVFAMQVPGNFGEPSHTIVRDLCARPPWRELLGGGDGVPRGVMVAEPVDYLRDLVGAGLEARVWETTYLHVLAGEDPVLEWMKGTALRPILSRLDPDGQRAFCAELAPLLRAAYPADPFGTVLPFRRLFAVGARPPAVRG
jgi:trans-aconitate 2-methyltransferase